MPTSNSKEMNRLFIILCMVAVLVFHTSCNDSVMDLKCPSVGMNTRAVDQRVQNLILQARQGDVEAYNSLVLCYRDGDGVEKSWLNMICMYAIYCQKTGRDIEDILELFDEGHPFKLLFEIMDSSPIKEDYGAKLIQLKLLAPAEAKAIEVANKALFMDDTTSALSIIRELEAEGSELAAIFQVLYYDKAIDKTGQEECLTRLAEKYPFFNLLLGDLYTKKYAESKDSSFIRNAIEFYYKADAYGMLIPKYANKLLGIYDDFGQKCMLEYDDLEIERLRILAKSTNKGK